MSFPSDDLAWAETAEFLRARLAPADRMVAPDLFRWAIPRAQRFLAARGVEPRGFEWVVTHKGELELVPRFFLDALPKQAVPVFANPVFVVWNTAPAPGLEDLTDTDHVRAFFVNAESLPPESTQFVTQTATPPPVPPPGTLRGAAPVEAPPEGPSRPWLPSPGQAPGAIPGKARERAFQEELDRLVEDYLGPARGEAVLDIGCGGGRFVTALGQAGSLTGIDIDESALARARARHAGVAQATFVRMDAERLGFPDASFDTVMMLDMIDTLPNLPAALAEAARVLARGGRLMVTAPNRDSLPLRALRRLGLPVPGRAFSVLELTGMIRAAGLTVTRSDGLFLSHAWALPGATGTLGPLEEDPEFVEAARILGRRAGPDYALAFCLLARKG